MRLIDKLMAKRDAAHAEYLKWHTMIEALQTDPDFVSIVHHGATKVMENVRKIEAAHKALAGHSNGTGNGNGTGINGTPTSRALRSAAARAAWTPERKAKYARRMKKLAKQGRSPMQIHVQRKARKPVTISAEERARRSERMKARRADPALEAKRLKALRKKLKAKAAEANA